jgi:hypothetical protein
MYAPQPAPPNVAVVRVGNTLVVPKAIPFVNAGMALPPSCVRCGARSTAPLRRAFLWHAPWVYLLIVLGLVPYAILALALRKRIDLIVPLCAAHRARRRNLILLGWLMALGGIAAVFAFGALELNMGVAALVCLVGIVGGGVIGVQASNPMTPVRIDDHAGTFKGCGEAFLAQLPSAWAGGLTPPAAAAPDPRPPP